MNLLFALVPIAVLIMAAPLVWARKKASNPAAVKKSVIINLCAFAVAALIFIAIPAGLSLTAAPEEDAAAAGETSAAQTDESSKGLGFVSAALSTGLACIGAGIAVASAAPAAIGAVSENPKSFGNAIIFVVLGEGVAVYGMLISIMIINSL
ncbi:MAG: ATP synthase subunit C [Oscillospiraceae bacterium]|jgi:V/A-type H+-transporting ATPase subunit K|nr:ATP synthase subunit C [Oscillospiraceae bacterium]